MPMSPLSDRPSRGGAKAWALVILGSLACLAVSPAPTSGPEPAAKQDGPPPRPPAAAAAAGGPTRRRRPATTGGAEAPRPTSMLMWAVRGLGADRVLPALPLDLLHGAGDPALHGIPDDRGGPPALVEKLDAAIKDRKFQEAYDACRDNDSFLARVVRTGVANLPNGRAEAKEAMNDVSEEIVIGMEARISYLAIIGTLGPMIGLVGTIWGMIMSFQEIATAAGAQPKPEKVAEGISTALFITLEGVSLAVPAIYFHALFRNRIAQMAMETTKVADRTINSLVAAAKQAKSA